MRIAANVLGWTGRLLAVLLVVVLLAPVGWSVATGDRYLEVTGTSMRPTYELGDMLVVRRPDGDELTRTGQVVVATFGSSAQEGPLYVHRVWEPTDDGAWLRGDGNDSVDPRPITQQQVVGTPRAHLSGAVGSLLALSQEVLPRVVAVVLALVLGMGVPALLRPFTRPAHRAADRARGRRAAPAPRHPARTHAVRDLTAPDKS